MKNPTPVLATLRRCAPRRKDSTPRMLALVCLVLPALLDLSAYAQSIKENNADPLNLGSSWVGGVAPASGAQVKWDSTVKSANTTVLGAVTTWNRIIIANPGGPVTINADGNALTLNGSATGIDMNSATADLTLNCDVANAGGGAQKWMPALGRTVTVNGILSGAGFTKTNHGTMILTGNNSTLSGTVTVGGSVQGGVLSIANGNALGTAATTIVGTGLSALWLSGGITMPNAISINGAAGNGVTDYGNIRNLSGNNTITGAITGSASPRIGCDSGTLEIKTGGIMLGNSTTSARGPNFIGAGNIIVSAPVKKFTSGSGKNTLGKSLGTGTLTLSAQNTYTGATTIGDGTTILDYTTVANVLPDATVLTLGGGALTLSGGSAAELVTSTSVSAGPSKVNRSSGTTTLRLNAISRCTGATVDFGAASIADTDTLNVNGILGGYATVAATDWAINSTGAGDGPITAYTGYQTATDPTTWAGTDNVSLSASPSPNVPSTNINSLRLTGAATVTIASGATLTNSSGGLLITSAAGTVTIAGADATAKLVGGSADLIVHQYSSSPLTISAVIANNVGATRLAKSGPGKLILTGANTFTGLTYLNEGTVSISAHNNLGDPAFATGQPLIFNGGTLEVTGNVTFDDGGAIKRGFAFGDYITSTIDVTGANVATVPGLLSGRGWLTKTGTGTLVLSGANTTCQNDFLINGGYLNVGVAENPGVTGPFGNQTPKPPTPPPVAVSGLGCLIHFGGGTLQYSAANNYDYSYRFWPEANQAYSVDLAGQTVTWASDLNSSGGSLTVMDSVGGGKLTLSGASTYNGGTAIRASTLALGAVNALPTGTTVTFGTATTAGTLDLAGFNQRVGGLAVAGGATASSQIVGNSSTANSATLTYNGGSSTFGGIIQNTLGSGSKTVGLTVAGGTLTLTGANTYSGGTTINAGTLALSFGGAINNSSTISIAAGATLDVSTLSLPYSLSSSTALSASGTGTTVGTTAATINGLLLGPVNLGTQPITLAYNGSNPALYVSQGTLQVQGNAWTINGPVLSPSTTYNIAAQSGGTVSVTGTHTVFGTAMTGMTGTISGSGANVQLTTSAAGTGTATALTSSGDNNTYGLGPTFTATVDNAAATGTVLFSIDGVPVSAVAVGVGGTASLTVNSLSAGTHAVVAEYSGDGTYGSSISSSLNQTVVPKALAVSGAAASNKVYDGTTIAAVTGSLLASEALGSGTAVDGQPYTGDNVSLSSTGTFASKDVANGIAVTVSLSGAQAGNYTVIQPGGVTANITAKALTMTMAISAVTTKVYDGTTAATLNGTLQATDLPGSGSTSDGKPYMGDTVTLTLSGAFNTKDVGTGKAVTSTSTLGGAQVANYSLTQPTGLTGTITPKALTVASPAVTSKAYDGTTTATVSGSLQTAEAPGTGTTADGIPYTGDDVTLSLSATFVDKHAGATKAMNWAASSIGGAQVADYTLTLPTATGAITKTNLTVTAATNTKAYDGDTTAAATGTITAGSIQTGDTAPTWTETYDNKNVGTGKTLTPAGLVNDGNGGANYAYTFTPDTTGVITQASLNVSANGTLVYGHAPATAVYTPIYYPLLGGDTAAVVSGSATFSTDALATSYVGPNYIVTYVDAGTLAAVNYSFTAGTNGIMTVTKAPLAVTNAIASDKPYDGTTTATIDTTGAGLDGLFNGDEASVTLVSGSAAATFDTKNIGTGKTVTFTGFTTAGDLGTNYTLSQPTTTAAINKTNLTVTAAANAKTYDGNTTAAAAPTITAGAIQTGDTAPTWTETYDTKHVGTAKTLTPAALLVNDGNGGANYNYTYAPVTTGVISQTNITVTAATNTKPYDGNTTAAAIPTVTSGTIQPGDTANFTETYDTPSVGTGKTLTPAGSVTDGNGGANYNVTFTPVSTGVITPLCSASNVILSIVNNGGGSFTLNFQGTEGAEYYVVTSSDLTTPTSSWTVVGTTNVAGAGGLWSATVTGAAPAYYRGAAVNDCP